MYEHIKTAAYGLGFRKVFFLAPLRLDDWRAQADASGIGKHLQSDLRTAYPDATCILLLVYPYAPHPKEERIGAYYFASQQGYHAAKGLAQTVSDMGVYCEVAAVPARALALANGVGVQGKNGLLRIEPFGSRIAIFTLATNICMPQNEFAPASPCPDGCTVCARACPMGAIGPDRLTVTRCMRYFMDDAEYPFSVREAQATHMGCEICQSVCPQNKHVVPGEPTPEQREAFSLPRLIAGDTAAARGLVGRNKTANGKLTAEAVCFAARDGLYEAEIRTALATSPFPAVQTAAAWVLARYFTETS